MGVVHATKVCCVFVCQAEGTTEVALPPGADSLARETGSEPMQQSRRASTAAKDAVENGLEAARWPRSLGPGRDPRGAVTPSENWRGRRSRHIREGPSGRQRRTGAACGGAPRHGGVWDAQGTNRGGKVPEVLRRQARLPRVLCQGTRAGKPAHMFRLKKNNNGMAKPAVLPTLSSLFSLRPELGTLVFLPGV